MSNLNSREDVIRWLEKSNMPPGYLLDGDDTQYPYDEILEWGVPRHDPDTPLRKIALERGPYAVSLFVRREDEFSVFGVIDDPETSRVYVEDCGAYSNPEEAGEVFRNITENLPPAE